MPNFEESPKELSWKELEEISRKYREENEERRKESAEKVGLPDDATWDQIVEAAGEKNREEATE